MFPGTHALTTPDKPAVIMAGSGRQLTYRELDDRSRRLAVALADLGLVKGDVIAMLSDNDAECFVIYWAALRSGLYLTAVNFHLTAAEVAYIVDDCGAKVLIADGGLKDPAAIAAAFAMWVVSLVGQVQIIHEISSVILFGLAADIFNTWVLNAGLLRWYLEGRSAK